MKGLEKLSPSVYIFPRIFTDKIRKRKWKKKILRNSTPISNHGKSAVSSWSFMTDLPPRSFWKVFRISTGKDGAAVFR